MSISDTATYSPVVMFKVQQQSDRMIGYAAPRAGLKPAALALRADDEIVCMVRASRFSEAALADGVRFGWCGFELPGLARALALGSVITVTCVASGETLLTLRLTPQIFETRSPPGHPLGAADVIGAGAAGERCKQLSEILPFAIDHRNRHGAFSVVEATYQMVVDQLPDPEDKVLWAEVVRTDEGLATFLQDFVGGQDFADVPHRRFPGPFHPSFRYDRGLLS